jgi:hypothetical protein
MDLRVDVRFAQPLVNPGRRYEAAKQPAEIFFDGRGDGDRLV